MAETVVVSGGAAEGEHEEHVSALAEMSKRLDSLALELGNKADRDHNHDEMYTSLETQLEGKAEVGHQHEQYISHDELDDLIIALDDDLLDAIGEEEHTEVAPGPEPMTEIGEGPEAKEEEHRSSERHAGSFY